MFITFSGLDGAGKTTQLDLFTEYLNNNNYRYARLRMHEDVSLSSFLRRISKKKAKKYVVHKKTGKSYRHDKNRKESGLVFLRKITYMIDLFIFLSKKFYYQRIRGKAIVMDRYLYDSLANLHNTKSSFYTDIMLKLVPEPDIAIFLDTEPKLAFERKPEYPPEFYPERRKAYLDLFGKLKNGFVVRSASIGETQKKIKSIFERDTKKAADSSSPYVDFIMKHLFENNNKGAVPENFEFHKLIEVLRKNRMLVRGLNKTSPKLGNKFAGQVAVILKERKDKVKKALEIIGRITKEFEMRSLKMVVIKTLDNYPDLGQDIDIYTNASIKEVDDILIGEFKARLKSPTFADKIAQKRNYKIEGFPTIEMHCSKLGQLGEDNLLAKDLIENRIKTTIGTVTTYIPKPEYRLLLCVLQRMYRHFNIRICDVYNTVNLIKSDILYWGYLKNISRKYGIWRGVRLYLSYIDKITNQASSVKNQNMHFRFPLFSTGINLYTKKILFDMKRLNLYSLTRLSFVVPLSLIHFLLVKLFGKSRIW